MGVLAGCAGAARQTRAGRRGRLSGGDANGGGETCEESAGAARSRPR